MGFLDSMKENDLMRNKAAAYDDMAKRAEQRSIYEQGLADKEREYIQAAKVPPQEPRGIPQQDQVSNAEMQELLSAGVKNPTMEDVLYFRRLKSLQQMQGGIGAAPDTGLAQQYGR